MMGFAPVLLLGPGRGGTTLLYKLLALHPDVAFISNFETHAVGRHLAGPICRLTRHAITLKRSAWFDSGGQAYTPQRAFLKKWVPAPVEGEVIYQECGLTLDEYSAPPDERTIKRLRAKFAALQRNHAGSVLLLKRTANNRRLPALMEAFPEARCIVLWRDGRAVTSSLLNVDWWLDHKIWWAGHQSPRELGLDRPGMVRLAAQNWVAEVEAIRRGLRHVPDAQQVHVRYEDVLRRPQHVVGDLLGRLGLAAATTFNSAIAEVGLQPAQDSWRRSLSLREQSLVEGIAGTTMAALGY